MKKPMHKNGRGQALVEIAILLPVLLLLLMLILDLGRGIYYYSVIHSAAREGARYGVVNYRGTRDGLIAGIISTAKERAIGLELDQLVITSVVPAFPIETGDILEVTAAYRFEALTPLVDIFIPDGYIDLTSTSTMYFEK